MKWEMGGGLRREGTYVCVFCCSVVYNSFSPIDCSLPGSSANGILQARILEWAAISSSRGHSWPRDLMHISCISCIGRTTRATWEAHMYTCDWVMLMYGRGQHNIVNQLSSNEKKEEKNYKNIRNFKKEILKNCQNKKEKRLKNKNKLMK